MILSYPLFKETHVSVTDQVLPDCEEALAGCVKGAYIKLSGGNIQYSLDFDYFGY